MGEACGLLAQIHDLAAEAEEALRDRGWVPYATQDRLGSALAQFSVTPGVAAEMLEAARRVSAMLPTHRLEDEIDAAVCGRTARATDALKARAPDLRYPLARLVEIAGAAAGPRRHPERDPATAQPTMLDRAAAWVERQRGAAFQARDLLAAYHGGKFPDLEDEEKAAASIVSDLRRRREMMIESMRDITRRGDPAPAAKGWREVARNPA